MCLSDNGELYHISIIQSIDGHTVRCSVNSILLITLSAPSILQEFEFPDNMVVFALGDNALKCIKAFRRYDVVEFLNPTIIKSSQDYLCSLPIQYLSPTAFRTSIQCGLCVTVTTDIRMCEEHPANTTHR